MNAQLQIENFVESHRDFVMIVDLGAIGQLPYQYVTEMGKWYGRVDLLFVRQNVRVAFLTPSLMTKFKAKAMIVMYKPTGPFTVVKTMTKALAWAQEQLAVGH